MKWDLGLFSTYARGYVVGLGVGHVLGEHEAGESVRCEAGSSFDLGAIISG